MPLCHKCLSVGAGPGPQSRCAGNTTPQKRVFTSQPARPQTRGAVNGMFHNDRIPLGNRPVTPPVTRKSFVTPGAPRRPSKISEDNQRENSVRDADRILARVEIEFGINFPSVPDVPTRTVSSDSFRDLEVGKELNLDFMRGTFDEGATRHTFDFKAIACDTIEVQVDNKVPYYARTNSELESFVTENILAMK